MRKEIDCRTVKEEEEAEEKLGCKMLNFFFLFANTILQGKKNRFKIFSKLFSFLLS